MFFVIILTGNRYGAGIAGWYGGAEGLVGFIEHLLHISICNVVDGFAIDIVEQHNAVAREAEAFGQRDTHVEVSGGGSAGADHVKVLTGVESDVSSRVFQHTAGRQVGFVRHMQGKG